MNVEFRLPDLGEGMAEAQVVAWLVAVGDVVARDQPVAQVETDKMVVDIPAPVAGTIVSLEAEEGDSVPTGGLLLVIGADEASSARPASDGVAAPPAVVASSTEPAGTVASARRSDAAPASVGDGASGSTRRRVRAAPAVRKLAADRGVDLTGLQGSGPGGRVLREDVLAASAARAENGSELQGGARVPFRGIRQTIARRMVESWTRIPQAVDLREVDATRLVAVRTAINDGVGSQRAVSFDALIVKFAAVALRRHPTFNSWLDDEAGEIVTEAEVNIGVAVATPDGIIVPVVRQADRLSLPDIAAEIARLSSAARARRLEPGALRGGTFTVNNTGALGSIGPGYPMPLINWPQSAILGFGRVADRVAAVDGKAVVRPTLLMTVVADHRLSDGADLVAFTNDIVRLIQEPDALLAS